MMDSCLDGCNSCVFAYGQTGAGKTWTMAGRDDKRENWGLARRFIEYLFKEKEDQAAKGQSEIKVSCEYMEIYCEELKDLFYAMDNHRDKSAMKNKPKLQTGMDKDGRVVVKNIVNKECESKEEMMNYFNEGNKHRVVHATAMNKESSRSHSVFTIKTSCRNLLAVNKKDQRVKNGKLNIIDLAGSERTAKSEVTGQQLKEANSINESLMNLGIVVSSLSEGEGKGKYVNYRLSKLTEVMRDSLGGTSKTLMFVNMSPAVSNAPETKGSLEYARNMKKITNTVTKSIDNNEVAELKQEIKALKARLG